MLKVLFIEDEPESVETVVEELKEKVSEVDYRISGFQDFASVLTSFMPDVIVLDVFRGNAAENDTAGLTAYELIWSKRFCPLIIYSARPDDVCEQIEDHPFVARAQKGANSEALVLSHIEAFLPHIEALHEIQTAIHEHVNSELKFTAPHVFRTVVDRDKRKALFVRIARRRIAAMMDQPPREAIACWEQYLFPPVGSDLLTGDILRHRSGDATDASSYLVVLTPSCDLVRSESRTPNVENVLAARCTQVESLLRDAGVTASTKEGRFKEKLLLVLTRGHGSLCVPLPELPGVFPAMAAELKRLELLDLCSIGEEGACQYCRVASVDSPFREMIMWAYLQVIGRPGLPERDFGQWADTIYSIVTQANQGGDA